MGAIWSIYNETNKIVLPIVQSQELSLAETREFLLTRPRLRYCLLGNTFFHPPYEVRHYQKYLDKEHRLCWVRIRSEVWQESPELGAHIPLSFDLMDLEGQGINLGKYYAKRHLETSSRRIKTLEYCSQSLIDSIAENHEVLGDISKRDFEKLVAELFARMGFETELFRSSKDGGIDFLAIKFENGDPIIICVQCKHPDLRANKARRALPVTTVREIYGVAKANDSSCCIAITSGTYSPDAKAFSNKKPDEIMLADGKDVLSWVVKYRWNNDE